MLEASRFRAGAWEGVWAGEEPRDLTVWHLDRSLAGMSVCRDEDRGRWHLRQPVPAELIDDGVQTFVLRSGAEMLGSFTIIAGAPLDCDLRAEISLLRAELDLLKSAFRRHCVETQG